MRDVREMRTPLLVREFAHIKMSTVGAKQYSDIDHERLDQVVTELRNRGVLD